jgi:hypothetical protein
LRFLLVLLLANMAAATVPGRQKDRARNGDILCAKVPRLPVRQISFTDKRVHRQRHFPGATAQSQDLDSLSASGRFYEVDRVAARSAPTAQQSAFIGRSLSILGATYLPLLLIALTLSALVLSRATHRKRLGWLAALVLFVYSYNLANCLEVAVIHSLQNPRYATVQMYFAILGQFLAVLLILEVLLGSLSLIAVTTRNDK